jgi:hypothetical protein
MMAVLLLAGMAAAQDCSKMYRAGGKPLLFGGLADRCVQNCQSRDDFWGRTCSFDRGEWGMCDDNQAANAMKVAQTLGGGAAMQLKPCDLVPYLRGRTLWILGDSHAKAFYKAIQCFLIDFWNHQECETSTDSGATSQLFNLPERSGFQKCLHLMGPGGGRICIVEVVLGTSFVDNNKIAEGGVMPLLRSKFARSDDIFFVNFGVWHKKKAEWWASLKPALSAFGKDFQANRGAFPHVFFFETPAEHPKDNNGQTCAAMTGYNYVQDGRLNLSPDRVRVEGWNSGLTSNNAASEILSRYGIPIMPTFAQSVPLHDNHIGTRMNPDQDCLHYCMPGVYQFWVWSMYDMFRSGQAGVRPLSGAQLAAESGGRGGTYTCVPVKIKF